MKAEHRVLLAGGSAIAGAVAEETVATAANGDKLVVVGMTIGGALLAIFGYVTRMDGVSDAFEAGGVGIASLGIARLGGAVK